jgi:hypothetical protein
METPDIIVTIPKNLTKDFLGILALDVLHDSKGHGYLVNKKLSQLTDLIAESAILLNEIESDDIKNYIFTEVLSYFTELWRDNLRALGLDGPLNASSDLSTLRDRVVLPLRSVANRVDDDAFASLGTGKLGIEAQNYHEQKQKIRREHAELMAFVSPKGVNDPHDYFRQAEGLVDIIRTRTAGQSRVVLDMKSAAGLIRTLTDPIGYTTGLPTYADPGYNMPGMSAVRQYSEVNFVSRSPGEYAGPKKFHYRVQLETELSQSPVVLLDVNYFYGIYNDGLDRNNLMISILDELYKNKLPRSVMMAEALSGYLSPRPITITETKRCVLEMLTTVIWNHYDRASPSIDYIEGIQEIYKKLHTGVKTLSLRPAISSSVLERWCGTDIFRVSYILDTLRNLHFFKGAAGIDAHLLFPEQMITELIPEVMSRYLETKDVDLLAFCYHELKLLRRYADAPGVDGSVITGLIDEQRLSGRRGRLVTQLDRQIGEWRKSQTEILERASRYIKAYLMSVLRACETYLGVLHDLDHTEDPDDPRIGRLLQALPIFKPNAQLRSALLDHLHFYCPEMYTRTSSIVRTGLLVTTLLDTIMWKKPLLGIDLRLHQTISADINPGDREYHHSDHMHTALTTMLGKFSGDFGQIMWSICNGHLFASEDNNASAMALMLHRLPSSYVSGGRGRRWGNIHGLGDGGHVDVTLNKLN